MLPEIGEVGQKRIRESKVLLVGLGGLGSPAALYLVAAGVGTLGLIDPDVVSLSNLQRQVLFDTPSVGEKKATAAKRRMGALNPDPEIVSHPGKLTAENACELVGQYDVVIDGSDNFPTRFAVADAAVLTRTPLVYGAIFTFDGQVSVFAPHLGSPCYRCMLPEPPPEGLVPT